MSAAIDLPLREARRRSERWLTAFITGVAGIMAAVALVRLVAESGGYPALPLLGAAYALYYGAAYVRAGREAPSRGAAILRTVLEVSAPTLALGVRAVSDAEAALLDAPVLLYTLAIMAAVLRLQPRLALLAGALASIEWLAAYSVLSWTEPLGNSVHGPVGALQRALILGFGGVLGDRIASTLAKLTAGVSEASKDRERTRRALGLYVAEPVLERVLAGDLTPSTERRTITVMFVDIRGFTSFSERHPPDEVLRQLATALDRFAREVQHHGGVVSKLLGDGLMAIFGAPVEDEEHARQAARAALAIAAAADELSASGAYPGLRIGVGVHCGDVVVGDMGGEGHREYTAIGDAVNVASRVEEQTKALGVPVLVTESVVRAMGPGIVATAISPRTLRGRSETTALYTLSLPAEPAPTTTRAGRSSDPPA